MIIRVKNIEHLYLFFVSIHLYKLKQYIYLTIMQGGYSRTFPLLWTGLAYYSKLKSLSRVTDIQKMISDNDDQVLC